MPTKESKRIKRLWKLLIDELPKFPNNKATRTELESKSLGGILIDYMSWRLRLVGKRPRAVLGRQIIAEQLQDTTLIAGANAFLAAVERGDEISQHLSDKARKRGYMPQSKNAQSVTNRWEDKDFLLNVMGMHHFHIGEGLTATGLATRSDEVIFAAVSRSEFEVLGVFDHSVFEDDHATMTPERERLWRTHDAYQSRDMEPGAVYIAGGYGGLGIATSGHPTMVVMKAQQVASAIQQMDQKLDDPSYILELGFDPSTAKLLWAVNHLDFGVFDKTSNVFGIVNYGPN